MQQGRGESRALDRPFVRLGAGYHLKGFLEGGTPYAPRSPPPNPPPRPPPGRPPPGRPPPRGPPPPAPGALGVERFTVSLRPSRSLPLSSEMARWASSAVAISTKPNPRDCPENLSVITAADSTVPHCAKYSRKVSLVVEYERPPTYSFEAIRISFSRSSASMHAPILGRANIGGEGAGCAATSTVYTM